MSLLGLAVLLGTATQAQTTILGSTGGYAVMAGSTVTSTGAATTINGDLGVTTLTGSVSFNPSGTQVSPITQQNIDDFTRAFSGLAAMTFTQNLTGKNLGTDVGAITLTPGVYKFTTAAALTGNLILDAQNQSNAVWVFQMDTTFNTTASSTVTFINFTADSVASNGLFWQVGGAAVFGANTVFEGNLLGGSTIGFGAGATINHGRALTATGTIGLATNNINFIAADSGYSGGLAFVGASNTITAVPEPSTYALLAGIVALATVVVRRRSLRATARA